MRMIITLASGKRYVFTSLGLLDIHGKLGFTIRTKITVKKGFPLVFGDAEGTVHNLGNVMEIRSF